MCETVRSMTVTKCICMHAVDCLPNSIIWQMTINVLNMLHVYIFFFSRSRQLLLLFQCVCLLACLLGEFNIIRVGSQYVELSCVHSFYLFTVQAGLHTQQ